MSWELIEQEIEYLQNKCGMTEEEATKEAVTKWLIYEKCMKEGVPWQ